jgi:ABC-type branched-subunit amino acid transport system permease subunit
MKRRLPPSRGRGPVAIASFIAIPLFFSSLMASTLAQEKPRVVQWNGKHKLITVWHNPSDATEARVWLWALVPALVLILIGWLCTRIPGGWYLVCLAGIVEAVAVTHKLDTWTRHHTQRFKLGVDLIPASDPTSNQYNPGEWEKLAHETAVSLSHWTIGLSLVAAAVMGALYVRRRFFSRKPYVAPPADETLSVHAPDATQPTVGDPAS